MSKSDSENSLGFSRRQALLSATAGVAAVAAAASSSDVSTVKAAGASCSTPRSAVAKTPRDGWRLQRPVVTCAAKRYAGESSSAARPTPPTSPAPSPRSRPDRRQSRTSRRSNPCSPVMRTRKLPLSAGQTKRGTMCCARRRLIRAAATHRAVTETSPPAVWRLRARFRFSHGSRLLCRLAASLQPAVH